MTCTSNSSSGHFDWPEQVPVSFTEWKALLSKLTKKETTKRLSSASDLHRRPASRQYSSATKKHERQPLPRNQVFSDTLVDSFLVSSSNFAQPLIGISRQDASKTVPSATKRYVSSFKTLVNSTSSKQAQRLSYVNDSVIILKLSKEHAQNNPGRISQLSSKHSTASMGSSAATSLSKQTPPSSLLMSSSTLKIEGQKHRTVHHDPRLVAPSDKDLSIPSDIIHTMTTSATSHLSANSSLFPYRTSVATVGSAIRQRAFAETTSNNLLITSERLKSNVSASMRPARQPLTTTTSTTVSSAYISSQQPQRSINQNTRSRVQPDKIPNSKDLFEYPDPFTNCPQDMLSKLGQLTKLQLETIDWEKKRRFTKRKPFTNGNTQGKDSP